MMDGWSLSQPPAGVLINCIFSLPHGPRLSGLKVSAWFHIWHQESSFAMEWIHTIKTCFLSFPTKLKLQSVVYYCIWPRWPLSRELKELFINCIFCSQLHGDETDKREPTLDSFWQCCLRKWQWPLSDEAFHFIHTCTDTAAGHIGNSLSIIFTHIWQMFHFQFPHLTLTLIEMSCQPAACLNSSFCFFMHVNIIWSVYYSWPFSYTWMSSLAALFLTLCASQIVNWTC